MDDSNKKDDDMGNCQEEADFKLNQIMSFVKEILTTSSTMKTREDAQQVLDKGWLRIFICIKTI